MLTNLNKKIDNGSYRGKVSYTRRPRKSRLGLFIKVLVILIILSVAAFLPLRGAYQGAKQAQAHAQGLASAYQNQNFGQLLDEVTATKKSLQETDTSLTFAFWMRFIPIIGGYYSDAKKFSLAGVEELTALEIILTKLKPHEKELGFLGSPLAGPDRISQAIKILDKAIPLLPKVEQNFKNASEQVKNIDAQKYPENFRGQNLRQTISVAKNFIIGADLAVSKNKDALEIAPVALGQPDAKNYLMLFQNDKEIRSTGGFLTAYAGLKLDRGQVNATTSDDIYRLDEQLLATCQTRICPLAPPPQIVKYLPEVDGKPRKAWSMRDSNTSPDVPTSAKEFERMYQLLGSGLPFDGIIYIDAQVVEELIGVTGPIEVFGTPFSNKIDDRCNCPNVIYELESYAEIAAKGEHDRKAILGVLMQQMLAKLVGADVEKIPQFIETVVRLANHKHLMFYMHDDETQAALAKLNWTGEIKEFDGDYLHINDNNFAGGKSNLYVEQTVTQDIKIKDGKVTKKITVEYKNPQKFNRWLNGINRDYVRFYVPKGAKLLSSKGSENQVTTIDEELGKTVFEAFITVRPENSRKLEIEYEIPYDPKEDYKIMIQKQPGAKDHHYIIKVNGSEKGDFKLEQDKVFKIGI